MSTTNRDQLRSRSRGRRSRWSAAAKARLLRRFAASGVGPSTFCRIHGLPRKTFLLWRRQAERDLGFAAVELPRPAIGSALTVVVRLAGGVEAELTGLDATSTATLLRQLLVGARA